MAGIIIMVLTSIGNCFTMGVTYLIVIRFLTGLMTSSLYIDLYVIGNVNFTEISESYISNLV